MKFQIKVANDVSAFAMHFLTCHSLPISYVGDSKVFILLSLFSNIICLKLNGIGNTSLNGLSGGEIAKTSEPRTSLSSVTLLLCFLPSDFGCFKFVKKLSLWKINSAGTLNFSKAFNNLYLLS
jgi:hypothetical protein